MNALLALDTSDRTAGVAVLVGGRVAAEYVETSAYRHSERLFALIDEALRGAGLARGELDALAVTTGPGSFTGLRVGLATAKGLAFALGLPVVGVSTLEALARGAMPFPGLLLPVLDARKRQVYAAGFDGATGEVLLPPGAWDPAELGARAAALGLPCLALGSGLGPYRRVLERSLGEGLFCAGEERWPVPPGQVGLLGEAALGEGRGLSAGAIVPTYLRRSEAEEKRAGS